MATLRTIINFVVFSFVMLIGFNAAAQTTMEAYIPKGLNRITDANLKRILNATPDGGVYTGKLSRNEEDFHAAVRRLQAVLNEFARMQAYADSLARGREDSLKIKIVIQSDTAALAKLERRIFELESKLNAANLKIDELSKKIDELMAELARKLYKEPTIKVVSGVGYGYMEQAFSGRNVKVSGVQGTARGLFGKLNELGGIGYLNLSGNIGFSATEAVNSMMPPEPLTNGNMWFLSMGGMYNYPILKAVIEGDPRVSIHLGGGLVKAGYKPSDSPKFINGSGLELRFGLRGTGTRNGEDDVTCQVQMAYTIGGRSDNGEPFSGGEFFGTIISEKLGLGGFFQVSGYSFSKARDTSNSANPKDTNRGFETNLAIGAIVRFK